VRAITLKYEIRRAFAAGVFEAAADTFLLLVAIRYFRAGDNVKGLVAVGGAGGHLFSPLSVSITTWLRLPAARAASYLFLIAGVLFTISAITPLLIAFVVASLLGMIAAAGAIPLLTQMYQDNYPTHERGKLFARAIFIRIATAAGFAWLAGFALNNHIEYFQFLMAAFALALFYSAWCLSRIPSEPLAPSGSNNPLHALKYLKDDSTFRNALISWMLMGISNLMMLPLRIEYLGNPKYGITLHDKPLDAATIAVLTAVVPNCSRLCMSPVWGIFFDKVNFFVLRIGINVGFATAILTFFTGNSFLGLIAGAMFYGISTAGGDLAWSLWVTKIAPAHRVAHYMSVHTFLTGLRGVTAPFLAFHLASRLTLNEMAIFNAGLIGAACLILVPEALRLHRSQAPAPLAVEELPEPD
jgi:MFS family permease